MSKLDTPEGAQDGAADLWNHVCETDAENQFGKPTTKHVKQRGGFTAIDAYHQIWVATRLWGPMGFTGGDPCSGGWGFNEEKWDVVRDGSGAPLEITFEGTFWYEGRRVGRFCADVAYRPGDDGRKKTLTDALTKALSYLGFSADVFLGAWDGKYTDERPAPRQQQQQRPPQHRQQGQQQGGGGRGDDGYYSAPPSNGGGNDTSWPVGSKTRCSGCSNEGTRNDRWRPGTRIPDMTCLNGGPACVREYQGKTEPNCWWSEAR